MANLKSAKKRIRSSARRHERNNFFRSSARTYVKKVRRLVAEGRLEEAQETARLAESTLDKAARKRIIHPRNAARRKGRLKRLLHQALTSAE